MTREITYNNAVVRRRMVDRKFVGWMNPPYPRDVLQRAVDWIEGCGLTLWLLMVWRDDACGRQARALATQHMLLPVGVRLFRSSRNGYQNAAAPCPYPMALFCFDRRPPGTKPPLTMPTIPPAI